MVIDEVFSSPNEVTFIINLLQMYVYSKVKIFRSIFNLYIYIRAHTQPMFCPYDMWNYYQWIIPDLKISIV